jgi:hypothetical protein
MIDPRIALSAIRLSGRGDSGSVTSLRAMGVRRFYTESLSSGARVGGYLGGGA